jgi:hypothetical protein
VSDEVQYILPPALTGRADLARLVRELEALDGDLEAQKVRARGQKVEYRLPSSSRMLGDFLEANKVDISDDQGRLVLVEGLRKLKDHAPVVHMTFAVDADQEALQQLVAYMRRELHPHTLVSVGLQPNLVAGVYMRTPNHVHDFSVKTLLTQKRSIISAELERVLHG